MDEKILMDQLGKVKSNSLSGVSERAVYSLFQCVHKLVT